MLETIRIDRFPAIARTFVKIACLDWKSVEIKAKSDEISINAVRSLHWPKTNGYMTMPRCWEMMLIAIVNGMCCARVYVYENHWCVPYKTLFRLKSIYRITINAIKFQQLVFRLDLNKVLFHICIATAYGYDSLDLSAFESHSVHIVWVGVCVCAQKVWTKCLCFTYSFIYLLLIFQQWIVVLISLFSIYFHLFDNSLYNFGFRNGLALRQDFLLIILMARTNCKPANALQKG